MRKMYANILKAVIRRSLATILILSSTLFSQPPLEFVRTFDLGNSEQFQDIFACANGDYIACGLGDRGQGGYNGDFWLLKTDENCDEIWSMTYEDNDVSGSAYSVIETDDGAYIAAGIIDNFAGALLADGNGNHIWSHKYGEDGGGFFAVIELKGGEFVVAGRNDRSPSIGYVVCLDGDGEVIWDIEIDEGEMSQFNAMRETEGGIVVAGNNNRSENQHAWFIKVDLDGEIIWNHSYQTGRNGNVPTEVWDLVSVTNGGFVACGTINGPNRRSIVLLKISDDGGLEWNTRYDIPGYNGTEYCPSLVHIDETDFVMVGYASDDDGRYPCAIRVDSEGNERWSTTYDLGDGFLPHTFFTTVIVGHDNSLIASGSANFRDEEGRSNRGLIVKLEPEILEPLFFIWSPKDTTLSVLPGDEVEFMVHAIDQQGDELTNLWLVEGIDDLDTLGTDTTQSITFVEYGEYFVECQVSDGELTSIIRWHVTAEEWYIHSYAPDTLRLNVQRPHEFDFNLVVRSVEEIEPNYRWILTEPDGGEVDVGDEAEMAYEFDIRGEYSLEGRVTYEDVEHSVHWEISVISVLHWWTPHSREITTYIDTNTVYTVIPLNPDSDSLVFRWLVDD